ncbi:MAG: NAD-dependent epimerase/dehydratase family protein, partial [Chthoniobacteraceae bacterium]
YGRAGERYEFIPTDAPLEPIGPYHSSKAAATMAAIGLASERRVSLRVLRPFHAFGTGEAAFRFWPSLVEAAGRGVDFPMTAGEQVRDFVPVDVVAAKFLRVLGDPAPPGLPVIENVGGGHPQTVRAFAEKWWHTLQAPGKLLVGAVPYRAHEVMRYVPQILA